VRRCYSSVATAVLLATLTSPCPLWAQLEPPSTGGLVVRARELRFLGHQKRVLVIGAHPDDEDTELLTVLVRGMGAEAAYLSLNRGEGGQNLIGPELGEALGLLRTEELLAARRLDGASQFFTRAYDFGFSKTQDETWSHWPRDTILKDVVRAIRRFRPQIIVSIFSGTPKDGHGQHQAAGWVAREAFRIAGDSTRFPELQREEQLEPCTPLKFYRDTWFDTTATTLLMEGGVLDSAVGLSFHQIAMAGRSLHRSQDMGRLQQIGPSRVRLALVEDRTDRGQGGLFAGIDTLLAPGPESADQRAHREAALAAISGVLCDARSDDDRVVPGQTIQITLECWNTGTDARSVSVVLETASGVTTDSLQTVRLAVGPGTLASRELSVHIAPRAPLTAPYFTLPTGESAVYDWSRAAPGVRGTPFEAPVFRATFTVDAGFTISREVSFRFNDQSKGEVRRPVTVVPRVDVRLDPITEVWPVEGQVAHPFSVALTHGAKDTTTGTVRIETPRGWPAIPAQRFRFTRENERQTFTFKVRAPRSLPAGPTELTAVAADAEGGRYDVGVVTVDYPHIHPRSYLRPASAVIQPAALRLPALRSVGYVRGASDRVPEALRSVGVPITLLDEQTLIGGDLDRFDAIVVGPRAYETDSALVESNGRLVEYARRGGLVIVQYQQGRFFNGGFAPYPMTLAMPHDRVTDERAPVAVLTPADPVVRTPNRIAEDDWSGWIQERGLYFARSWDQAYRPIIESHDAGEQPLRGGLLIARVGAGKYVYTGLSFFRQLPAGVPGAFRLFANLLALARPMTP
jgi:LmbE family N-acetylglucosaminyl deacetylase